MKFDPRALLRDKRMLAVVAAGGLLGAVALIRKGAGGQASDAAATTTQGTGYSVGALGTYSDGGIGAYNNLQTSMDNRLGQFQDQLSLVQEQLEGLRPAGTSSSGTAGTTPTATSTKPATPTGTTGSIGKPAVGKAAPVATAKPAATQKLAPGYGWFATGGQTYTVDAIAKRYNITTAQMLTLNPALKGKKTVAKNTPVKVRSNAAAWDLAAYRKVNAKK